jgi:hypothetical protein
MIWRRLREQAASAAVSPEGRPRENFALKAFAHGNTCLAEGKFADATAAFHEARELDPKHPHVAGRLAEVARQQAASAMDAAKAAG